MPTNYSALTSQELHELQLFCDGPITQQMVDDKVRMRCAVPYVHVSSLGQLRRSVEAYQSQIASYQRHIDDWQQQITQAEYRREFTSDESQRDQASKQIVYLTRQRDRAVESQSGWSDLKRQASEQIESILDAEADLRHGERTAVGIAAE